MIFEQRDFPSLAIKLLAADTRSSTTNVCTSINKLGTAKYKITKCTDTRTHHVPGKTGWAGGPFDFASPVIFTLSILTGQAETQTLCTGTHMVLGLCSANLHQPLPKRFWGRSFHGLDALSDAKLTSSKHWRQTITKCILQINFKNNNIFTTWYVAVVALTS